MDAETRELYQWVLEQLRDPASSLAEAESVLAEVGMAFGRGQSTKWNPQGQTRLLVEVLKALLQRRRDSLSQNETPHRHHRSRPGKPGRQDDTA